MSDKPVQIPATLLSNPLVSPATRILLAYLECPSYTSTEVAKRTGVNHGTIMQARSRLVRRGLLVVVTGVQEETIEAPDGECCVVEYRSRKYVLAQ